MNPTGTISLKDFMLSQRQPNAVIRPMFAAIWKGKPRIVLQIMEKMALVAPPERLNEKACASLRDIYVWPQDIETIPRLG